MGCGESKIKKIHLAQDGVDGDGLHQRGQIDSISRQMSSGGGGRTLSPNGVGGGDLVEGTLPNRLLAAMPVSDLGESLDSRHLGESLNMSHHSASNGRRLQSSKIGGPRSADSTDSADSGYDEYDEENSHIVTEKSDPALVRQVEEDFRPVELPELLVITGRACARIVSGYQRGKQEESKILDKLREEGLLAKPKGKTAGGMSFEVVDAGVVEQREAAMAAAGGGSILGGGTQSVGAAAAAGDAFVSARFMPKKKLERLEERRVSIRKPSAKRLEARLADAEERRRAAEEERVKKVLEHGGVEKSLTTGAPTRMKSARGGREGRYSASVARRTAQLQEMRDKLKERNRKADMARLKRDLSQGGGDGSVDLGISGMGGGGDMESGFTSGRGANSDGFFDD